MCASYCRRLHFLRTSRRVIARVVTLLVYAYHPSLYKKSIRWIFQLAYVLTIASCKICSIVNDILSVGYAYVRHGRQNSVLLFTHYSMIECKFNTE